MEKFPKQATDSMPPKNTWFELDDGSGLRGMVNDNGEFLLEEGHPMARAIVEQNQIIDAPSYEMEIKIKTRGLGHPGDALRSIGNNHIAAQEMTQIAPGYTDMDHGAMVLRNSDPAYPPVVKSYLDGPYNTTDDAPMYPMENERIVEPQSQQRVSATFADKDTEEDNAPSFAERHPKAVRRLVKLGAFSLLVTLISGPAQQSGQAMAENCGLNVFCWPGHFDDGFNVKNIFNYSTSEKK